MPIVSHLGSKDPSLLGNSPLERSLVRQWITFQVDFPLFIVVIVVIELLNVYFLLLVKSLAYIFSFSLVAST